MNDGVTVWTDRNKIHNRIYLILPPDLRQRDDMVHMDVPSAEFSERLTEVEVTRGATMPVMSDASRSCLGIAFEGVD